jgi:hypothetical protein
MPRTYLWRGFLFFLFSSIILCQDRFLTKAYAPEVTCANDISLSITASPLSITPGGTSILSWNVDYQDPSCLCTAVGGAEGWSGSKPFDGQQGVFPNITSTYGLKCTAPGSLCGYAEVTVTVLPPPEKDSGIRLKVAGQTFKVAAENNEVTSALRLRKNNQTLGIVLVDPAKPEQFPSPARIRTKSNIRALKKYVLPLTAGCPTYQDDSVASTGHCGVGTTWFGKILLDNPSDYQMDFTRSSSSLGSLDSESPGNFSLPPKTYGKVVAFGTYTLWGTCWQGGPPRRTEGSATYKYKCTACPCSEKEVTYSWVYLN